MMPKSETRLSRDSKRVESDDQPIPLRLRVVRGPKRSLVLSTGMIPHPDIVTGDHGKPFHFSLRMKEICEDIANHSEPFWHLKVDRMLFTFTQARSSQSHGLQARVTPMRFRDGAPIRNHRGRKYRVQQYLVDESEILYIVTFCLPRFLNRTFDDKLITIFHELYHISPFFNGDLRRHAGRCEYHTSSQKGYDREMAAYARGYIQKQTDSSKYDFLRLNYSQLIHRHPYVVGYQVPRPKLIPIEDGTEK
jgi:hypothetical protein